MFTQRVVGTWKAVEAGNIPTFKIHLKRYLDRKKWGSQDIKKFNVCSVILLLSPAVPTLFLTLSLKLHYNILLVPVSIVMFTVQGDMVLLCCIETDVLV